METRRWVRRTGMGVVAALLATTPFGAAPAQAAEPAMELAGDAWLDVGGINSAITTVKKAAGGKVKNGTVDTASLTGAGIGVALIDSGIAPVAGLNQPGKVINGPDLSFESQTPGLQHLDTYGHGTHMAGIIAGSDPSTGFEGVAPGAHLISLKTAAYDGAVDVSQVIAAIDWVVAHRSDPGLNIRVLNLSFGTDSIQPALIDPLSYAVETAWKNGIVVVASTGNDGAARVTMPAANPYVLAIGAADPNGTEARADDTIATFSNRGNAVRHPDLIAAGRSLVSLRAPGSYIDTQYPAARVGDKLFRGSGTSQAAAVVSGSVALLLQQRPGLTPDQVKQLLINTADPLAKPDPIGSGAGQLDIAEAASVNAPSNAKQKWPDATGLGSLEAARGGSHVADGATGAELVGERDIFGMPWVSATWVAAAAKGKAWTGGTWNGSVWSGSAYNGTSWASITWAVVTWTGRSWNGRSWAGDSWAGRSWNGGTWTGRSWASGTWAGRSWAGRSWA
ncbi:S8 family serine peptidase [Actinoplanes sp. NPDC026670]|uniref:S8 family serine peptidase n=1 Tax=Actinoplanes sp. NPDC026670 TaxID=3154700 RepID=UPI0033DF4935